MPSRWWPTPKVWAVSMFVAGILVGALGLYAVSRIEGTGPAPQDLAAVPMPTVTAPAAPEPTETVAVEPASDPLPASIETAAAETSAAPSSEGSSPVPVYTEPANTGAPPPAITSTLPALPATEVASLQALPRSSTWLANALPEVDSGGRPMVAIIIDDVGVDRANSPGAIALPAPVTLSFMSYADGLGDMTQEARARGHELMLHLPMEPVDPTIDPGPHGLRLSQSPTEIESNVQWALARFEGYIGVNNHMGSLFTRSREGMGLVLAELRRRGLMFLDSRTVADSIGATVASELGVPNLVRDVFLDNDPAPAAIEAQFRELERIARERGYAIAIGHPYPSTLAALNAWLPTLKARGIVAVPVSTILRQKLGAAG
jgi:polysaccharide deacetylase 2 family uncharacterized protein YibQ